MRIRVVWKIVVVAVLAVTVEVVTTEVITEVVTAGAAISVTLLRLLFIRLVRSLSAGQAIGKKQTSPTTHAKPAGRSGSTAERRRHAGSCARFNINFCSKVLKCHRDRPVVPRIGEKKTSVAGPACPSTRAHSYRPQTAPETQRLGKGIGTDLEGGESMPGRRDGSHGILLQPSHRPVLSLMAYTGTGTFGRGADRNAQGHPPYHARFDCHVQVYAPTVIYVNEAERSPKTSRAARETESDASLTLDVSDTHHAQIEPISDGKRATTLVWLIGRLQRILRRVSLQYPL